MATANTCDPQLRTHLESYDYWVECIPCEFKSEESPSLKDATVAMGEHMAASGLMEATA